MRLRAGLVLVLLTGFFIHCGEDKVLRLRSQFQTAMQKRDFAGAAEIVAKLAESDEPEAAKYLLTQVNAGDGTFYAALRKALADFKAPAVTALFAQQYKAAKSDREWEKRVLLGQALAGQSGPERAELVKLVLNDPHPKVRLAAIRGVAAGSMRLKEKVPFLIQGLAAAEKAKDRGTPHLEARLALIELTGNDFTSSGEWENFWKASGADFDDTKKGPKTHTDLLEELAYFGVPVTSQRLLFILDISSSMNFVDYRYYENTPKRSTGGSSGGGGADRSGGYLTGPEWRKWIDEHPEAHRIKLAKMELKKLIEKLPETTHFNIITYWTKVESWRPTLVEASAKEKKAALKFVEDAYTRGNSAADQALEEAFKANGNADTIYFLSDGIPSRDGTAQLPVEPIHARVSVLNRFSQMIIHGFSVVRDGEPFLKPLAEQNGGKYKCLREGNWKQ